MEADGLDKMQEMEGGVKQLEGICCRCVGIKLRPQELQPCALGFREWTTAGW